MRRDPLSNTRIEVSQISDIESKVRKQNVPTNDRTHDPQVYGMRDVSTISVLVQHPGPELQNSTSECT